VSARAAAHRSAPRRAKSAHATHLRCDERAHPLRRRERGDARGEAREALRVLRCPGGGGGVEQRAPCLVRLGRSGVRLRPPRQRRRRGRGRGRRGRAEASRARRLCVARAWPDGEAEEPLAWVERLAAVVVAAVIAAAGGGGGRGAARRPRRRRRKHSAVETHALRDGPRLVAKLLETGERRRRARACARTRARTRARARCGRGKRREHAHAEEGRFLLLLRR
jgi:hypothetical protein